jgi:hypothetical protein
VVVAGVDAELLPTAAIAAPPPPRSAPHIANARTNRLAEIVASFSRGCPTIEPAVSQDRVRGCWENAVPGLERTARSRCASSVWLWQRGTGAGSPDRFPKSAVREGTAHSCCQKHTDHHRAVTASPARPAAIVSSQSAMRDSWSLTLRVSTQRGRVSSPKPTTRITHETRLGRTTAFATTSALAEEITYVV